MSPLDLHRLRADFPSLTQPGPTWLDSAATSLTLRPAIEAVLAYYNGWGGPVGRSAHAAAEASTLAIENARRVMAGYLGTKNTDEIIFVSGTTAGINLFTRAWQGRGPKRIVTSLIEHHSNLLPWRELAERDGYAIEAVGLDAEGAIDMPALETALQKPADCVALSLRSNVTGARLDVKRAAQLAHEAGAILFVDAAQEAARGPLDLALFGADAAAFSSHKMHGPTGSGVLWVRKSVMAGLRAADTGGGMADQVAATRQTYRRGAARFEAGSLHVAGILGMAAAAQWLTTIGRANITNHEDDLGQEVHRLLAAIPGVRLYSIGGGIVSFTLEGWHAHDAAASLDAAGFAVRAGTLCAQPCLDALGVPALIRASLAVHSTAEECRDFSLAVQTLVEKGLVL